MMFLNVPSAEPKITLNAKLWDIYQKQRTMAERLQEKFYLLYGDVLCEVAVSKMTYMLAYALSACRGPMASGNWLRLPIYYNRDAFVEDGDVVFLGSMGQWIGTAYGGTLVNVPLMIDLAQNKAYQILRKAGLINYAQVLDNPGPWTRRQR